MKKICFKCKKKKNLLLFYKHKQMPDGHLNKCIECAKKDSKFHRIINANNIDFIIRDKASKRKWSEKNRLKRKAHSIISNLIRDGKIFKKPCEKCGAIKNIQAHHNDYTKPLIINWLCTKHHGEHHRNTRF